MFQSIKMYIYGAIAAVGLFLVGMLKFRTHQKENLEKELKVAEHNNEVIVEKTNKEKEINKALSEAKQKADEVENENNKRASTRTRPSGNFGDTRLRNKD